MTDNTQGLVAFDLDGTLLRGATVCELLAEPLGRLVEMKRFETLTSEPEIAAARAEMASWYYGHGIADLQVHLHNACWAPGAREGVALLQRRNVQVAIASITWSFAVRWFAQRLSVHHYLGTELRPSGEIVHIWGRDKGGWLRDLGKLLGVPDSRIAAVGDSNADAEMLREARLRFFVGSKPPLGLERVIHIPSGDMRVIAERILEEWTA